jgi:hypothetical protein
MVAAAATTKTKRRGWRRAGAVVAVLVLLWVGISAKLFIWPARDPVAGAHADAVVVLNFSGPRWQVAEALARERAAPVMLVSVASVEWNCPRVSFPRRPPSQPRRLAVLRGSALSTCPLFAVLVRGRPSKSHSR